MSTAIPFSYLIYSNLQSNIASHQPLVETVGYNCHYFSFKFFFSLFGRSHRISHPSKGRVHSSSQPQLPLLVACLRRRDIYALCIVTLLPVIWRILIPVVHLLLQRLCGCRGRLAPDNTVLVALAELQVLRILAGDCIVRLALAPTLEHALVVPRAQTQPEQAAHDVRDDVVEVKVPVVGQDALQKLGADAEDQRAYHERHVNCSPAIRVDDPVEDDGEEEKSEQVQHLVVDQVADLEFGQTGIRC